jgi:chemotaxis response regulator CheB
MSASLASEIARLSTDLAAAAESSGLADARPRSSEGRRRWESNELLAACAGSLDLPSARMRPAARRMIRIGALAACEPGEVPPFFALWRDVLAERLSAHEMIRVGRMLERLEEQVNAELPRWLADRVDTVALGASAGGINALTRLIDQLPVDLPATILVVLHISDESPSVLPQVLGRGARLPIETATDGGRLYLSHIYVAAAGHHLVVRGGLLHLTEAPREHFSRPSIDVLFRSVAGANRACVLLSGSGSDGAIGCEAVRAAGGISLAQDPRTAEFTRMPEEAIARGVIQRMGAPEEMGRLIARVTTGGRRANRL